MKILASPILDQFGRQVARPIPPAWFADAVELWARKSGRSSSTRWEPKVSCFVSFFSRRADDPVMRAVQEGKAANEGEPFYWHEFKKDARPSPFVPGKRIGGHVPLDIEQLGVNGVTARLEKVDIHSGRGEFASLDALTDAVIAKNERREKEQEDLVGAAARERASHLYRKVTGNPQVSVTANIS